MSQIEAHDEVSPAPEEAPAVPGGLPIAGHALRFLRSPLTFLEQQRAYGDVVRFRLGRRFAYIVNTPDTTRELLVHRGHDVKKGILFEKLRVLVGNGIGTSEGRPHLRRRRMLQPAFHREQIARYARNIHEATLDQVVSWKDGQAIDAHDELHAIATRAAGRSLFSTELDHETTHELMYCFPLLIQGAGKRAFVPVDWPFRLPTPGNRRFTDAHRRIHAAVDHVIARYRTEGVDHKDILSMLLTARDEDGACMTDQEVHDEVMSMLTGATETSAVTMWWMFHILDRHAWIEDQVIAELDRVLGDRDPEFDDIAKLDYLNRVVNETLRMFPPGWLLTRSPIKDIRIAGCHIPAGTTVFWSPYVLHTDPRSFAEPGNFDPDRWLPERATHMPRDAYIPFGMGNRMCIGNTFAQMEIPIVIATIIRRWKLRPRNGVTVRPVAETSLHPERVPMILEPRRARRFR